MITVPKFLTKKYGESIVMNIENLEIPKERALVNRKYGAGKTTSLVLCFDLIPASTGHIINNGVQVDASEAWKPFYSAFY